MRARVAIILSNTIIAFTTIWPQIERIWKYLRKGQMTSAFDYGISIKWRQLGGTQID